MAKYRCCETCGQRIPQRLWCYSSGDGALHFSWVEDIGGGMSANRQVTKADIQRFLKTKEGKQLVAMQWLPFFTSGHWVMAKVVKRVGKCKVEVDHEVYTYKIDKENIFFKRDGEVVDCALEATFRHKNKLYVLKNGSIRMVIRYFLNHEKELAF